MNGEGSTRLYATTCRVITAIGLHSVVTRDSLGGPVLHLSSFILHPSSRAPFQVASALADADVVPGEPGVGQGRGVERSLHVDARRRPGPATTARAGTGRSRSRTGHRAARPARWPPPRRRSPRASTPSSRLASTSWHFNSTLRSRRRRRRCSWASRKYSRVCMAFHW